jgi:large subunit ribosomal protein L10
VAITRARKEALVAQYRDLAGRSKALILASYSGLSVRQLEGLRNQIRELGGEFHIVKNSLIRLALQELKLPTPENLMEGTTAVGFAAEDVPAVAKAIVDLGRENPGLRIKAGVIEGSLFNEAQMVRLADLPPLPVVQAQLLGVLNAPARRTAGALAAAVRGLASVLQAYSQRAPAESG